MVSESSISVKVGLMPDHEMKKTIKEAALMKGRPKWAPQSCTALASARRRSCPDFMNPNSDP